MLRCAITNGTANRYVNAAQIDRLQTQVRRWADDGIDLIQLREKQSPTKLLINTRADVAIAARAHGVHLTSHADELTPQQVRELFAHAELASPVVSVSCHTADEVARARDNGADFILFGTVFEKRIDGLCVANGSGLDRLREACELARSLPVLALGGVMPENEPQCLAAGAAGVAGIRIFL
jgi:thiamine-phosphate pyrophosphorylase